MFPRSSSALALVLASVLGGCASVPDAPPAVRRAGNSNREQREAVVPEKDRVLHDYRQAASALRAGRDDEAKARLDDAIARIGGIITNDEQAAKARGLFNAESSKPFIGEPYERVMAYYYRGILYWRDGQPDNARACFRSGQVIDSDPVNGKYQADYVLLDYLEGLASVKLQADGADAWARAQGHAGERLKLPAYTPSANVLIFAEYGYGPRKYAAGQYGEQLRFRVDDSPSRSARLVLDEGRRIVPLPVYDDLGYQAATRGGRVMDYILGNKAVFKSGANVAGDLALFGAIVASQEARRKEWRGQDGGGANNLALGLGLLGVIGKVAAAATQTQADTRQWNNLPQRLSFAALKLAPGEHAGRLEFLDRAGNILAQRTQQVRFVVAADERDTVVFLSELKP